MTPYSLILPKHIEHDPISLPSYLSLHHHNRPRLQSAAVMSAFVFPDPFSPFPSRTRADIYTRLIRSTTKQLSHRRCHSSSRRRCHNSSRNTQAHPTILNFKFSVSLSIHLPHSSSIHPSKKSHPLILSLLRLPLLLLIAQGSGIKAREIA